MHYNLSFDIAGVIFLILLLLVLQNFYVINSKSSKYFRSFLIISIISGILDITTAITIDYSQNVPAVLNLIINTIYMFFASYTTFAGTRYIFSTVKLNLLVNRILIVAYTVLLFINLFTGVIFDFRGRTYNHGPLYLIAFLESFIIMFYSIGVLIYNHKLFTKKQLVLFSSFVLSPVIFVSFQFFHSEYLMTVFSSAASALLIIFAIETPDFVELEYLRKNLEKEVQSRTRDLKKANNELKIKNKQAKQDMDLAAHLQQALYLHGVNYLGWDIAIEFEPLSGISGDLYDFYEFEGLLRGIGLFDVSGHGISSGLVTVLAKNTIFHEFRAALPLSLSEAMYRINNSVIRIKGDIENYMTGTICRINKEDSSKLEIVNAGAPYPVYKSKNKKNSILITPDKKKPQYGMIGVSGLDVCFQTIKRKMNIDDFIVFYTDGIIEAENETGEQYGIERLQSVINKANGTAQDIMDTISADFKNFVGEQEIEDDISVIVLKRVTETIDTGNIEELESID